MKSTTKKKIRTAALTAAILIFAACGINRIHSVSASASGAAKNGSPSYFNEDASSEESSQSDEEPEQGGQDNTPSESSDESSSQQDNTELIRQYSARVNAVLDELESHAKAMITAGNAGDRKKYDKEQKAFKKAKAMVGEVMASCGDIPYDDAAPIADKAYDRLSFIEKLCKQAEAALANSLGGAMDGDGKQYSIKKVVAKVSQVGKSDENYDAALQGLGNGSNEKENKLIYKISLFIGQKPVHLIGGLTKSVTIGIPGDKIGRTPVTSYYLCDAYDGNNGAPIAEKRGYFDTSTWCLTVKVSKPVTYYIVCGRPGSKAETYGDDTVALQGKKHQLTAGELSEMISSVRLEDGNHVKAKALEAVKAEGKSTAVYEIALSEDVTLLPDAQAVVDMNCPEAAEKTVEVYRIAEDSEPVWVGTFMANKEGKLQLMTDTFGIFVLCWQEDIKEETPAVVITPTDTAPADDSVSPLMVIIGVIAAMAVIGGAAFLVFRNIKK